MVVPSGGYFPDFINIFSKCHLPTSIHVYMYTVNNITKFEKENNSLIQNHWLEIFSNMCFDLHYVSKESILKILKSEIPKLYKCKSVFFNIRFNWEFLIEKQLITEEKNKIKLPKRSTNGHILDCNLSILKSSRN